jgi:transmembrane sensor
MRALGTRFSVRIHDHHTRIAVLEHAVEIRPRDADVMRLEAGHAASFDERGVQATDALAVGSDSWTRGNLMVNDRPLSEVIAELARYRAGEMHCSSAVAGIRVSGVLPIDDTDRALAILAGRFPIVISARPDGVVLVDPEQ